MSIDAREFRNALGQFSTGVCLMTLNSATQGPLALTANSFASVSLDPPLVLWSLQNNSDVFDAYAAPQHFGIGILSAEQQALSDRYARKGEHQIDPEHFAEGTHGSPLINMPWPTSSVLWKRLTTAVTTLLLWAGCWLCQCWRAVTPCCFIVVAIALWDSLSRRQQLLSILGDWPKAMISFR